MSKCLTPKEFELFVISKSLKVQNEDLNDRLRKANAMIKAQKCRIKQLEDQIKELQEYEEDFIDGFLSEEDQLQILLEMRELMK